MSPPQSSAELAPGVRRLRPDDHFMVLVETDASPMHVGALIYLDVPPAERKTLRSALQRQFSQRLPATPLLCRLIAAPEGFDADVWADVAACDLDYHVAEVRLEGEGEAAVRAFVAACSMTRLDLSRPPFRAFVLDVPNGPAAVYFKMHHAVADGIGFQTVLSLLSDAQPPAAPRAQDAAPPPDVDWRARAEAHFQDLAPVAEAFRDRRRAAREALKALDLEDARPPTPVLRLSGPTSACRNYATASLSLARVKAAAEALEATVNDIFLTIAATALREYLIAIDDLPDAPLVINSARSYRQVEHGAFGNRIVALHPHIATDQADPIKRLRAIQAEMARERKRSPLEEAQLDAPEQPFGARDRRVRFGAALAGGGSVLPGNITLSNVPGPARRLAFAGYEVLGNYPVPIIGSGRFLNITSRRHADQLDLGVMTDSEKIANADPIAQGLHRALALYEELARNAQ